MLFRSPTSTVFTPPPKPPRIFASREYSNTPEPAEDPTFIPDLPPRPGPIVVAADVHQPPVISDEPVPEPAPPQVVNRPPTPEPEPEPEPEPARTTPSPPAAAARSSGISIIGAALGAATSIPPPPPPPPPPTLGLDMPVPATLPGPSRSKVVLREVARVPVAEIQPVRQKREQTPIMLEMNSMMEARLASRRLAFGPDGEPVNLRKPVQPELPLSVAVSNIVKRLSVASDESNEPDAVDDSEWLDDN